jgi:chitin synthase
MLLGAVLGLPGVLILISTFKIVYIGWMFIYLLALPICTSPVDLALLREGS